MQSQAFGIVQYWRTLLGSSPLFFLLDAEGARVLLPGYVFLA
jgi:hypothetical protein